MNSTQTGMGNGVQYMNPNPMQNNKPQGKGSTLRILAIVFDGLLLLAPILYALDLFFGYKIFGERFFPDYFHAYTSTTLFIFMIPLFICIFIAFICLILGNYRGAMNSVTTMLYLNFAAKVMVMIFYFRGSISTRIFGLLFGITALLLVVASHVSRHRKPLFMLIVCGVHFVVSIVSLFPMFNPYYIFGYFNYTKLEVPDFILYILFLALYFATIITILLCMNKFTVKKVKPYYPPPAYYPPQPAQQQYRPAPQPVQQQYRPQPAPQYAPQQPAPQYRPAPRPVQPAPRPVQQPVQQRPQPKDNVTQMKEYKELLDAGVITQEEFDRKKKELLNL